MVSVMDSMRIALVSCGINEFSVLHEVCMQAGHSPVAYVYGRSKRPSTFADVDSIGTISQILITMPPAMDLLLPGNGESLGQALAGYDLDLIVVYGFPWRIPSSVLTIPRFGAINIPPSLLPRYRGPSPVLWAIRNGDPAMGITVHRMDENFD